MNDIAIRVENLGKLYHLGSRYHQQTFRELITHMVTWPGRWMKSVVNTDTPADNEADTLWAIKNVSFEVKHGEVIGIIGRNGAGKSTLLKILSRITEPTEGRVEGFGRVGSLLEVGTGFHAELTGRENIYLNGAILGMKKAEIDRKFDEIVAFSEIEKFLETPVKRYSSGMYVRLAFAVAAHLEPEILIVDEVLAVGDAAFQKKCLGRMQDVGKAGRTVVFVSHNMLAIQSLCQRVIWLDQGKLREQGSPNEVASHYLNTAFTSVTEKNWPTPDVAPGDDAVRIHRINAFPNGSGASDIFTVQTPIAIEVSYWNLQPDNYLTINLELKNEHGIVIFDAGPSEEPIWRSLPIGLYRDRCVIPANLLNDGTYEITLRAISDRGATVFVEENILVFTIHDTPEHRAGWFGKWRGIIRPILPWQHECLESGGKD